MLTRQQSERYGHVDNREVRCQRRLTWAEDPRTEANTVSPRFLTLADVADILNISSTQAYALVRSGELKGIQIGGRNQWRVERSKLEQYIADAYERTAANLNALPSTLPAETAG